MNIAIKGTCVNKFASTGRQGNSEVVWLIELLNLINLSFMNE